MLTELGKELKRLRERHGASLQAVALPAKISGAYLHKLEQGKIDTPSPRVLRRLAAELGASFLRLMELAGYLDASHLASNPIHIPEIGDPGLTPEEWRSVRAFINMLIAQRSKDDLPTE